MDARSLALVLCLGLGCRDTPVDEAIPRTNIDESGGVLVSPEAGLAVVVPTGALSAKRTLAVSVISEVPAEATLLGSAFELSPSGTHFDVPVTLSFAVPAGAAGQPLTIVRLDELRESWKPVEGSTVLHGRVYAQTDHFSVYALASATDQEACRSAYRSEGPGSVHPLLVPGGIAVEGAVKSDTPPLAFTGPNPLELASTWTASQRFVGVRGNAGIEGEGGRIDWISRAPDRFEISSDGSFFFWLDLHQQGPHFGLTDACLLPTSDDRHGWLYALDVNCDQRCLDDPSTTPPDVMMPSCGPVELCTRSIDECSAMITQPDCEAFYANAANCRDMPAYTACNCECITAPTCTDYFDCGQQCFDTHCV
ncbi:MAG: hypothetical protein AAGF12_11860 [Myxococcota bacterium]